MDKIISAMRSRLSKYKTGAILFGIFIFHVVNNYIIIAIQGAASIPISVLESKSYASSLEYLYRIQEAISRHVLPSFIFHSAYSHDPPVYFLSALPFYHFFGLSKSVAIMSNNLYLLILLFSVFYIGKKLWNEQLGLLAAFITSMFPAVLGYSRIYHIPFALLSLTALSVCLLLHTEEFTNVKYSVLFGLSVGILGLIRFTGAVYLAGPFICQVLHSFWGRQNFNRQLFRKISNLLLSFLTCLFILSLWYLPKGGALLRYYSGSRNMDLSFDWKTVANADYLYLLANSQLLPVFTALFCISVFYFLFQAKKGKWLILSWISVPYAFFTFFWAGRESYQVIPCLPAVAIIISYFLTGSTKRMHIRTVLISAVIVLAVSQFAFLSYGNQRSYFSDYHLSRIKYDKVLHDKCKRISQEVMGVIGTAQPGTKILVLSIAASGFNLESLLHEINLQDRREWFVSNPLGVISGGGIKLKDLPAEKKQILESVFVIYTSDNRYLLNLLYPKFPSVIREDLLELLRRFEECKGSFLLIKEIPLDMGFQLLIYKRLLYK